MGPHLQLRNVPRRDQTEISRPVGKLLRSRGRAELEPGRKLGEEVDPFVAVPGALRERSLDDERGCLRAPEPFGDRLESACVSVASSLDQQT